MFCLQSKHPSPVPSSGGLTADHRVETAVCAYARADSTPLLYDLSTAEADGGVDALSRAPPREPRQATPPVSPFSSPQVLLRSGDEKWDLPPTSTRGQRTRPNPGGTSRKRRIFVAPWDYWRWFATPCSGTRVRRRGRRCWRTRRWPRRRRGCQGRTIRPACPPEKARRRRPRTE